MLRLLNSETEGIGYSTRSAVPGFRIHLLSARSAAPPMQGSPSLVSGCPSLVSGEWKDRQECLGRRWVGEDVAIGREV